MPILSVYTIKGGVGKTTVIQLLSVGLASAKKRVLVIDADLQADLSYRLLGESLSAYSLTSKTNYGVGAITLSDLPPIPQKVIENLYIIPMEPDTIVKADERLMTNFEFLDKLRNQFDYILIDTPPSYDFVVASNIMKASDFIFTIVTPSVPVIRTVNLELLKVLPAVASALKRPASLIGIVKNMIHTSRFVTTDQINTLMANLEQTCQQVKIPKYTPCFFPTPIPQRGILGQDRLKDLLISPELRKKLYSIKHQASLRSLVNEFINRAEQLSSYRP